MSSNDLILKEAQNLLRDNKYIEIINLINDELLSGNSNSNLYLQRARAHYYLNQLNESLKYVNLAILVNSKSARAHHLRAKIYQEKKMVPQAFEDYEKAININPNLPLVYLDRGILYKNNNEFENALNDFTHSIELDSKLKQAYNNRGNILRANGDFEKAIKDYEKAISIDKNYFTPYYGIGNIYYDQGEFDKALEFYNQTININPNYANAYNGLGNVFLEKGENKKSLKYYKQAIKINPELYDVYYNIGYLFNKNKNYKKALLYFKKAYKLNPEDTDTKYWIDNINAIIGEAIDYSKKLSDKPLYLFVKAVESLNPKSRKAILKLVSQVMNEIVSGVRDIASKDINLMVAHYTKLKVADIIVSHTESRLRYYNAVYMNDPEEGKVLLECINEDKIISCFNKAKNDEEDNIYIGSFLPSNREDDLVMWRTYGKDENRHEATGCSLVISNDFFDKDRNYLNPLMKTTDSIEPENNTIAQPLYKVLYFDKMTGEFLEPYKKEMHKLILNLNELLLKIIAIKDKKDSVDSTSINIAINKVIYHILAELRHFIKSSDYSYENELRVIQFASYENVKIDEGDFLPRKLFIESTRQITPYITKIWLGPKVNHSEQWVYLKAKMKQLGYTIELNQSNRKFQ